jgi:hypothetical protein
MSIDRRDFISTTGLGALGLAIPGGGRVIGNVTLPSPIVSKVVQHNTRNIPHGTESEFEFTLTGSDGTVVEVNGFSRRIELEDSYSQAVIGVYNHDGQVLLRTENFVSGKKGSISDGVRYDDIEITNVRSDGTVSRQSQPNVAVPLKLPTTGMPLDEVLALMTKYHEQTWTTGNAQTLQQFLQANAR